jgi:CIC family chloride channel protein
LAERPVPISRLLAPLWVFLLAIVVGGLSGVGAVVFRGLIALVHNLAFLGRLSWTYDANVHTPPSVWGPLVILVPVIGAAGVAFLVKTFAPEAKGHGVPEVMDAIYYQRGVIRPVVAVIKSIASALSIGTGGAVGREGPIIQIGSSLGSTLGQLLHLTTSQRVTLIAAGTGGGIAATFNTPIGGVLFAVEIALHEISVRTLVPVAAGTAMATYVSYLFFGTHPSFIIPTVDSFAVHRANPYALLAYVVLGVLLGIVSALFIRAIYGVEDLFEKRIKGSYILRHMGGMLIIGLMMYGSFVWLGQYYIEGVGYATVQDILGGRLTALWLLLLLFVMKLAATSLTLGSGASGGIFSPALFLGSTFGGAYGALLEWLVPGLGVGMMAFAVAGMAGVVGGSTGAALAAIVMIFEMTRDYDVIVPMTLTVAVSYGVRRVICRESIYTMKLARRGHAIPDSLQANLPRRLRAGHIMDTHVKVVPADMPVAELSRLVADQPQIRWYLLGGSEPVQGIVPRDAVGDDLDADVAEGSVTGLASRNFVFVRPGAPLPDLAADLRGDRAQFALVGDADGPAEQVRGVVTREQIEALEKDMAELFPDG